MAQTYTAYVVSVRRIPGDTMADYVFEYEEDGKKLRVTSRERSNSTAAEGDEVEITVEDGVVTDCTIRKETRRRTILTFVMLGIFALLGGLALFLFAMLPASQAAAFAGVVAGLALVFWLIMR